MEVTSTLVDVAAEEEDEVMLPGFRFHPTDEELVGFYLRRKVEKKLITIEIIKQIDIYKYDPWDLPKVSNVGEKEWYFFCIRGRKYRNSIRPNRVTGSGFWKATGIDKPIFSTLKPPNQECIGLKKSLVYYRGSAGKGTKTDWMMHEFRLPAFNPNSSQSPHDPYIPHDHAEVWTLCRIFRRIPSFRKYTPTTTTTNNNVKIDNNNINPIISPTPQNPNSSNIIFTSKPNTTFQSSQPFPTLIDLEAKPQPSEQLNIFNQKNSFLNPNLTLPHASFEPSSLYSSSFSNGVNGEGRRGGDDVFTNGGWDELQPIVQFAIDPSSQLYRCI